MKEPLGTRAQHGTLALYSRRKFLRKALIAAAYVAPVVLSYPSTVFAAHCAGATMMQQETNCGGANHMSMGMTWSPGCSVL